MVVEMDLELIERLHEQGTHDFDWLHFTFIIFVAMIFGFLLNLLYSIYFRDNEPQDYSLSRSLVLMTPALTATFWMIQSSLILSLGLLGTLSFVRFRTPIKRAEDIAFIIIALAVSVALAINAFPVAIVLVSSLFFYSLVRNAPFFFQLAKKRTAIITFNTKRQISSSEVIKTLAELRIKGDFVSARSYDGITSYVFNASKISQTNRDQITDQLLKIDESAQINIFFPDSRIGT